MADWNNALVVASLDKADIAIIIALASAAGSLASAAYTRRMAKNDTERMKRKSLVFEAQSSLSQHHPGWHDVRIIIRNFEPVTAVITHVQVKRWSSARILGSSWFDAETPWSEPKNNVSHVNATRRIALDVQVDAIGYVGADFNSGPVRYCYLYSTEPLNSSDLKFEWSWLDGSPK